MAWDDLLRVHLDFATAEREFLSATGSSQMEDKARSMLAVGRRLMAAVDRLDPVRMAAQLAGDVPQDRAVVAQRQRETPLGPLMAMDALHGGSSALDSSQQQQRQQQCAALRIGRASLLMSANVILIQYRRYVANLAAYRQAGSQAQAAGTAQAPRAKAKPPADSHVHGKKPAATATGPGTAEPYIPPAHAQRKLKERNGSAGDPHGVCAAAAADSETAGDEIGSGESADCAGSEGGGGGGDEAESDGAGRDDERRRAFLAALLADGMLRRAGSPPLLYHELVFFAYIVSSLQHSLATTSIAVTGATGILAELTSFEALLRVVRYLSALVASFVWCPDRLVAMKSRLATLIEELAEVHANALVTTIRDAANLGRLRERDVRGSGGGAAALLHGLYTKHVRRICQASCTGSWQELWGRMYQSLEVRLPQVLFGSSGDWYTESGGGDGGSGGAAAAAAGAGAGAPAGRGRAVVLAGGDVHGEATELEAELRVKLARALFSSILEPDEREAPQVYKHPAIVAIGYRALHMTLTRAAALWVVRTETASAVAGALTGSGVGTGECAGRSGRDGHGRPGGGSGGDARGVAPGCGPLVFTFMCTEALKQQHLTSELAGNDKLLNYLKEQQQQQALPSAVQLALDRPVVRLNIAACNWSPETMRAVNRVVGEATRFLCSPPRSDMLLIWRELTTQVMERQEAVVLSCVSLHLLGRVAEMLGEMQVQFMQKGLSLAVIPLAQPLDPTPRFANRDSDDDSDSDSDADSDTDEDEADGKAAGSGAGAGARRGHRNVEERKFFRLMRRNCAIVRRAVQRVLRSVILTAAGAGAEPQATGTVWSPSGPEGRQRATSGLADADVAAPVPGKALGSLPDAREGVGESVMGNHVTGGSCTGGSGSGSGSGSVTGASRSGSCGISDPQPARRNGVGPPAVGTGLDSNRTAGAPSNQPQPQQDGRGVQGPAPSHRHRLCGHWRIQHRLALNVAVSELLGLEMVAQPGSLTAGDPGDRDGYNSEDSDADLASGASNADAKGGAGTDSGSGVGSAGGKGGGGGSGAGGASGATVRGKDGASASVQGTAAAGGGKGGGGSSLAPEQRQQRRLRSLHTYMEDPGFAGDRMVVRLLVAQCRPGRPQELIVRGERCLGG